MKNKVFSLLLLGAMFALPFSVNAEEVKPSDFNDSRNVTVGEVDATVYSVDIEWVNLSFDYKYDKTTNSFSFVPPLACQAIEANASYGLGRLQEDVANGYGVFDDNTCTTAHTGEFQEGNTYYVQDGFFPTMQVEDRSINGKIKAKASFTPSGSYANWVVGKFYEYTTYDNKQIEYHNELDNGYLASSPVTSGGGIVGYSLTGHLKLDINNQYNGEKVVEAGSTIGTLTLEISQDTD